MKIISVVGARPNFMKIGPFSEELLQYREQVEHILVHTGQHYDQNMSEDFFNSLKIREPDINLNVGSESHAQQTAQIMQCFEPVCIEHKPDWVVVVGDVNSTLACTLVAVKLGIKVAHIEAGLRSFDRSMPEEINRLVTDALADLLFTPSVDAGDNLLKEGVAPEKIHLVGNIMIDTLVSNLDQALDRLTHKSLGLKEKEFVYITLHRPNNVDHRDSLNAILKQLKRLSEAIPIVFPLHPRTRHRIKEFGWGKLLDSSSNKQKIFFTEPISYYDSICLAANSKLVITDSGGLQEETTYLGVPCLTLRPNTERPITISQGTNKLTDIESIEADIHTILNGRPFKTEVPPLWDGHTAKRIVKKLIEVT